MDGKARYIFPVLVTAIIVFVVSAMVTYLNVGFRPDYLSRWLGSFFLAWPIAAAVAFIAIPIARRGTQAIIGLIEKKP